MASVSEMRRQNSSINRVFPMPGSPKIMIGFPSPERTARHASIRVENSVKRPAKQLSFGAFDVFSTATSADVSTALALLVPLLPDRLLGARLSATGAARALRVRDEASSRRL